MAGFSHLGNKSNAFNVLMNVHEGYNDSNDDSLISNNDNIINGEQLHVESHGITEAINGNEEGSSEPIIGTDVGTNEKQDKVVIGGQKSNGTGRHSKK